MFSIHLLFSLFLVYFSVGDWMNYYNEIKDKLIKNEVSRKVREYYGNRNDLTTYYDVGKLLSEAGKHYGESIIKNYAIKLEKEVGKKYNWRTLFRMRKYYEVFSIKILSPFATILSWSHYVELLSLHDYNEMLYYINLCIDNNITRDGLRKRIKEKEYQRLPINTKNKLIKKEETTITDLVKNPIVIRNNLNKEEISEKYLKKLILEDLDSFLNELVSNLG